MARVLCDKALEWLEDLPPFERGSKDIQGTLHAIGMEVERIDAAKAELRDNFFPATAEDYLFVWERQLGLSTNPPDKTLAQRRTSALGFLAKLRSEGTGLDWQDAMDTLLGTGWSYEEHDPGDPSSPDPHQILVRVPYAPALSAPAAVTSLITGGTLTNGVHTYVVTALNPYGETTIGASDAENVSGASKTVRVTWSAVTGASAYRVYRKLAGETVYSRIAELTATTYDDTGGAATGGQPPSENTTEGFQAYEAKALARRITPAHIELLFGYTAGFILDVSRLGDAL